MIDLDYIGWLGSAFIIVFYWLNGTGRGILGYWCSIIGAALWLGIGVASGLSSLVFIEFVIIVLCFRAMYNLKNWREKEIKTLGNYTMSESRTHMIKDKWVKILVDDDEEE